MDDLLQVRAREVYLPRSLMYPVEITSLLVKQGDSVKKHDPIFQYKYWNEVPDGVPEEGEEPEMVTKEFYATFESPLDGSLDSLLVKIGDRINDHTITVLQIKEPCDHSVQYGGLCAICGSQVDGSDYMGYSDADRAPIAMSHSTSGLTVSRDEAERIERSSNARLLKDRKLILVVDLDQTIIHAAVDPNVGKWINDRDSPNHEAVKEVKSFILKENSPDGPVNCWYYVKLRPGLKEFLEKMNEMFEMHIYTMATKVYAREIAKIVDPDGKLFADRILSREESGNLLQKNISRLFPVTTSLVTIIDDRGDVWQWSPHLVRVFPYNFFSGTGDINSGFLPQRNGLVTPETGTGSKTNSPKPLQDNDHELSNLTRSLTNIHREYYREYDELIALPLAKKEREFHKYSHQNFKNSPDDDVPDIGVLLPRIKSRVFDGYVFLFSGIFPMGTSLDSADIVQWVRSFGAVVVAEFIPSVTHVIADSGGTVKARQGAGAGAKVVSMKWIFSCLENWSQTPEDDYVIHVSDPILPKRKQSHSSNGSAHSNTTQNGTPARESSESGAVTGADEDNESDDGLDADRPANCDEPESEIAESFVRSLSRGDMDWNDVDDELREMMGSDASDVFDSSDDEDEAEASGTKRRWSTAIEGEDVENDANTTETNDSVKRTKPDANPTKEVNAIAEVEDDDDDDEDFAAELAREFE